MKLLLLIPSKKLVESEISEVIIPTTMGEIGVLPGHASLVCDVVPGVVRFYVSGKATIYAIGKGIAEIREDCVNLLVDTAEEASTIDLERAKKALQRSLERLEAQARGEIDTARAQSSEARAQARLQAITYLSSSKK